MIYKAAFLDDEESWRFLYREMIDEFNRDHSGEHHIFCSFYSNPHDFMHCVDNTFDFVVIDIMMPQMSGFDVYRHLAKRCHKVRTIIASNSTRRGEDFISIMEKNDISIQKILDRYHELESDRIMNCLEIKTRAVDYGYA